VDPDQIAAEDDLLAVALTFHFESKAQIFEDLQTEGFEAADGAIDGGAEEVEAADADGIVFGAGSGVFQGRKERRVKQPRTVVIRRSPADCRMRVRARAMWSAFDS